MKIIALPSLGTRQPTMLSHSVMNYKNKKPKKRKANRTVLLGRHSCGKALHIYFEYKKKKDYVIIE